MTEHDPLCRQQHWDGGDCFDCRLIAKVRADEQKQYDLAMFSQYRRDRDAELTDLRAKVEALTVYVVERRTAPMAPKDRDVAVLLSDVLALIDGADHG